MHHAAVARADGDGEPVLRVLVRRGRRVGGLGAVTGDQGDLAQLPVEELGRLAARVIEPDQDRDDAGHGEQPAHPAKGRAAQGYRPHDLRTIQPVPRTLKMTSLPNLRRMEWIRTSTALLSTSSFQP